MQNSLEAEIFLVMSQLRDKFNAHISGNINQNQLEETVETESFIGEFNQFHPSGGHLIAGQNLINADGVATVTQDLRFQISIRPNRIADAQPLRLEVDNEHRVGRNKIIHVNPAGASAIEIPSEVITRLSPDNCIDLVRISSSSEFRSAIGISRQTWHI